jgi:hypothetical protein
MNKDYIITKQGSIGLLALGHIGIIKWREVLKENKKDPPKQKDNDKKKK